MSSSRTVSLLAWLLIVGACGFQLRTEPRVPPQMARTYIDTVDSYSLFYRNLRRELQAAGVELVDNPADATATFRILSDETDQRVLSVSARNVPREYEVYYSVYYELRSGGETLLQPQLQTATRDYRYDETRVLGKASEEELLRRSLASDLVRTVLVQLSSL